jgi:hypothetical protein
VRKPLRLIVIGDYRAANADLCGTAQRLNEECILRFGNSLVFSSANVRLKASCRLFGAIRAPMFQRINTHFTRSGIRQKSPSLFEQQNQPPNRVQNVDLAHEPEAPANASGPASSESLLRRVHVPISFGPSGESLLSVHRRERFAPRMEF